MGVRLEASGLDPLPLDGSEGVYCKTWDLGFPEIRGTSSVRVDQDGEDDTTARFGARLVTLELEAVGEHGTIETALDRVRAFLVPSRRPWLYVRHGSNPERRVRLRPSNFGSPVVRPVDQVAQVQFRAPDGIIEASTETIESTATSAGKAWMVATTLSQAITTFAPWSSN